MPGSWRGVIRAPPLAIPADDDDSRYRGCRAILCFHDVRDRTWLRGFLRAVAERSEVVSLASLVERHSRAAERGAQVAVTFDDGYKSIRTIVEPVCTELGIPFTTFVCG